MPVEQEIYTVPRVEMTALTEDQMCKPGAVKLIYTQLAELKAARNATMAELQAERQRSEALMIRAHSCETNCSALKERLRMMSRRDTVARIIEFVITILLAYAIDFAKSGQWKNFVVFTVLSVALGLAIFLVDRGEQTNEG